jgi:hypothetical protein
MNYNENIIDNAYLVYFVYNDDNWTIYMIYGYTKL